MQKSEPESSFEPGSPFLQDNTLQRLCVELKEENTVRER